MRPEPPVTRALAASRGRMLPAAACLLLANFGVTSTLAQQPAVPPPPTSIPGLVVSTTPPAAPQPAPAPVPAIPGLMVTPPSAPPGMVMAPPPAPPPKTQPKPAPKKAAAPPSAPKPPAPQGIAALVNDEPITAFEVERRSQFMSLGANFQDRARANMKAIAENPATNDRLKAILEETIKANPGRSRDDIIKAFEERKRVFVMSLQQQAVANAKASLVPTFRKKALEELIEERLKMQEAKRLTVAVGDEDVERAFKSIADRNKMTPDQFSAYLNQQGGDPGVMKARLRAQLAWREVIRKRFGHQINVSGRDVERLAAAPPGGETQELQMQKITFSVPGKIDQTVLAQRYEAAEALRRKFAGCKGTAALVKDQTNVKFEDLGFRSPSSVSEPTRTLLVSAGDGEMVPPALTASGVELYAVCGRRTQKISDDKRQAAENELTMKEFDRLAQRHMHDLRKDALIEIR